MTSLEGMEGIETFDADATPQTCYVCNRAAFLRCIKCFVSYCSGSCQMKNWFEHRQRHMQMNDEDVNDTQEKKAEEIHVVSSENRDCSRINDQNRLMYASSKTDVVESVSIAKPQNVANNHQIWRKKSSTDLKSLTSEDSIVHSHATGELIKRESKAMSSMGSGMIKLAQEINVVSKQKDEDNVIVEPMETMDEVSQGLEEVKITEHPLTADGIEIDGHFNRPMISLHKYDRMAPIPPSTKDFQGFFMARVTYIDSYEPIYSVTLATSDAEIVFYKQMLNINYNENYDSKYFEIKADEFAKYLKALLMVKIVNQWARCRIQSAKNDKFILVDIDSGKKYPLDEKFFAKHPREPEMMKSALSFNVKFQNYSGSDVVKVDDLIKIRLLKQDIFGVSTAEVLLEKKKEEVILKQETNFDYERVVDCEPVLTVDRLKIANLVPGHRILTYLDGSQLTKGKIHVCDCNESNQIFYEQLYKDIQKYIEEHPQNNNYKPKVGELILAVYNDGDVYRAVCMGVSVIDCKVHFIDYGSTMTMPFSKVWKMPLKFGRECVSSTVTVKLKSKKPLENVNIAESLDKFVEIEHFNAFVEPLSDGKFAIIIDDSLLVFNDKKDA